MKDSNIPTLFQKMRSHRPRILAALAEQNKKNMDRVYYDSSKFKNMVVQHLGNRGYFRVVGFSSGKFIIQDLTPNFELREKGKGHFISPHDLTSEFRPI